MTFDWLSPMVPMAEIVLSPDAPYGQAGARLHASGNVTITVMPDRGTFPASATITQEHIERLVSMLNERKERS